MRTITPKQFKVVALRETAVDKVMADSPEKAAEYFAGSVRTDERWNPDVESLVVLIMNTRRRVIGHVVVATGTLDTILVHAREVFRAAIVANASAIILMHNHPSGDPMPSEADIRITRDLIRAGQLLKIDVLDHVIIGDFCDGRTKDYSSLRELGYFYS
jgi:DNA repair protein RadC